MQLVVVLIPISFLISVMCHEEGERFAGPSELLNFAPHQRARGALVNMDRFGMGFCPVVDGLEKNYCELSWTIAAALDDPSFETTLKILRLVGAPARGPRYISFQPCPILDSHASRITYHSCVLGQ